MRKIDAEHITQAVREMAIEAACDLEPDILEALVKARDTEESQLAKDVLELLLINADMASREKMPVCQDTGICTVFISVGQAAVIEGNLYDAVQKGVRLGYEEGYLRKSVCDPLTRKNTGTNTPAVIHFDIVPGDTVTVAFLPKGCGSENMSRLTMLPPSAGTAGIIEFVAESVWSAGSNPCPPVIVGVGIGGTFEKSAFLAKKSLLRQVGQQNARQDIADLEKEILELINRSGQGAEGFGGNNTALAVHIDAFPSHIASLPVAVNIQCHAHRYKQATI